AREGDGEVTREEAAPSHAPPRPAPPADEDSTARADPTSHPVSAPGGRPGPPSAGSPAASAAPRSASQATPPVPSTPAPAPAAPGTSGTAGVRRRLARLGAPRGGGVNPVLEPLIKTVRATHPKADIRPIERAYEVAAYWHADQKRKSGDPYITHPLAVSTILA